MGWVSIEERRPTESGAYYVAQKGRVFTFYYDVSEDLWHDGEMDNVLGLAPDHWMPLPEAPKKQVYYIRNSTFLEFDEFLNALKERLSHADGISFGVASELITYEEVQRLIDIKSNTK